MASMKSKAMLPVPEEASCTIWKEMHTFAPKCKIWSHGLHGPQNGLDEHKVYQSHLRNTSQGPDLMVADLSSQLPAGGPQLKVGLGYRMRSSSAW